MAGAFLDKDRILALLGSGLPNGAVASAVGCQPSYITELMAKEEFAAKVIELRTASLLEANQRDSSINAIEDMLISKVHELVETQQIYKPRDVLAAFNVLNKAVRRGNPTKDSVNNQHVTVELTLPNSVTMNFVKNIQNEIVEIEGRPMQTMPAQSLLKHLAGSRGPDRGKTYEQLGRFIAPTIEVDGEQNSGGES
jgi:hypothetical protein